MNTGEPQHEHYGSLDDRRTSLGSQRFSLENEEQRRSQVANSNI